jgi:hypothetical protein
MKELKAQTLEAKKYDKLMKSATSLKIKALQSDLALNKSDTARAEISQRMIDDLSKDFYLEESVSIMKDIIKK